MTQNIGNTERLIRAIVGIVMIAAYFFVSGTYSWLLLLGIVPLATSAMGWCPPYQLLGINTCRTK